MLGVFFDAARRMGGRAAAMRSFSGKRWRGGPQLTRCWCPQPALGANWGGVPRSATLCGGNVTVRAQPQPREWALHVRSQAAPRSTNFWARGRHRKWQPDHGTCQMRFLWAGGARSDRSTRCARHHRRVDRIVVVGGSAMVAPLSSASSILFSRSARLLRRRCGSERA